jgi:hypothetical protein
MRKGRGTAACVCVAFRGFEERVANFRLPDYFFQVFVFESYIHIRGAKMTPLYTGIFEDFREMFCSKCQHSDEISMIHQKGRQKCVIYSIER